MIVSAFALANDKQVDGAGAIAEIGRLAVGAYSKESLV